MLWLFGAWVDDPWVDDDGWQARGPPLDGTLSRKLTFSLKPWLAMLMPPTQL
jgi:hypothetical protein